MDRVDTGHLGSANIEDLNKTIKNSGCYLVLSEPRLGRGKKVTLQGMGVWRQFAEYLYIKKKDPNAPKDSWIKYMHGINRISIFMFLVAIIVMIVRLFFKKH